MKIENEEFEMVPSCENDIFDRIKEVVLPF